MKMIMIQLLCLLYALSGFCNSQEPFSYFIVGAAFPKHLINHSDHYVLLSSGVSAGFGKRGEFSPFLGWDAQIGLTTNPLTYREVMITASILLYPISHWYLGTGVTNTLSWKEGRSLRTFPAFPILAGYQWPSHRFIQVKWDFRALNVMFGHPF